MSRFFIDRPIFAWVIALFIAATGALSLTQLPIQQYPAVAPPAIQIATAFPGASAQTLEDSVLAIIEREMHGSPGLMYMESVAQADGSGTLTLSFEQGSDVRMAQVDVQNRLNRALPRLPASVVQQGVRVEEVNNNFLLFVVLSSSDAQPDLYALGDQAARTLVPALQRGHQGARRLVAQRVQVGLRVAAAEHHEEQKVVVHLLDAHALLHHAGGQARQGAVEAVLHIHLRHAHVAALLKA